MLKVGQVIVYDGSLWRVDLVNPSRARIVPLVKHRVVIRDKAFDAEEKGTSISPNSCVEVVEDVEQTLVKIEERRLQAEQRKLEEMKAEVAAIEREEWEVAQTRERLQAERRELQAKRQELHTRRAARVAQGAHGGAHTTPGNPVPGGQGPRTGGGWHLGPTRVPTLTTGSQAALVVDYITTHPGLTTGELAVALPAVANMPQCLSRLKLTGYLEKKG